MNFFGIIGNVLGMSSIKTATQTLTNKYTAKGLGFFGIALMLGYSYLGLDKDTAFALAYALSGMKVSAIAIYAISLVGSLLTLWTIWLGLNLAFRHDDINKAPIVKLVKYLFLYFTNRGKLIRQIQSQELQIKKIDFDIQIKMKEKELKKLTK